MRNFSYRTCSLAIWFLAAACGSSSGNSPGAQRNRDEYAQAGVVAAIAMTAAIVQTARAKALPISRPSECCAICDQCSFPCGDTCLPIGSICAIPAGCACYDTQLPPEHRPPDNSGSCPKPLQDETNDAIVAPIIVVH